MASDGSRGTRRWPLVVKLLAAGITLAAAWFGYSLYERHQEAKRREKDAKALFSTGLGLHGHHGYKGSFPPGTSLVPGQPPEKGHRWMVHVLPYMENVVLFKQLDLAKPWDSPPNAEYARQPYNFLIGESPTETNAPYVGVAGVGTGAAELAADDPRGGVFAYGRTTRLGDITDGTDNTMMLLEAPAGDRGPWMSGGRATVRGLDPARPPYLGQGGQFGHKGGAMVLYTNGAVRWVSDSVDPKVFEAMATIHGGEQVPAEYHAEPPKRK
jgi:hypothetical protein